jgi:hypothetical protein
MSDSEYSDAENQEVPRTDFESILDISKYENNEKETDDYHIFLENDQNQSWQTPR